MDVDIVANICSIDIRKQTETALQGQRIYPAHPQPFPVLLTFGRQDSQRPRKELLIVVTSLFRDPEGWKQLPGWGRFYFIE